MNQPQKIIVFTQIGQDVSMTIVFLGPQTSNIFIIEIFFIFIRIKEKNFSLSQIANIAE